MKARVTIVFALLIFSLKVLAQVIPASRRVDWTLAGLQQPRPVYSHLADITSFGGVGNGIVPNDAALQAAIVSLGADSGIIYFPPGTYLFLTPITLRSGLVLHGQDASTSSLVFNLSGANDLITISGSTSGIVANLTAPAYKNDQSITVSDASLFAAGDYIKLFQDDSSLVYDVYNVVGQIVHIQSISGNTISFSSPLRRSYNLSDSPQIRKLTMNTGSGIECLKIKRLDSTATQRTNILFRYAAKCWVKGVESDSANFAHISLNNSTNIEITGCYIHGSFGYGPGGQGYGIATNATTCESLVENNIFSHLRHAMLVQSGSNGNAFMLNYAREPYKSEGFPHDYAGDIVLHGNYPYANLFEGNIVQNIVVDASHSKNGPMNTFFRNRAELYGILFSSGSGDSSNVVGNEITATVGNYSLSGSGNFEYANNIRGTILPAGTTTLSDSSYYYSAEPEYWGMAIPFPSIGIPNYINNHIIPARARYLWGSDLSLCPPGGVLALPVFLFTAEKKNNANMLSWEINNVAQTKQFDIERSYNGVAFAKLFAVYPAASQAKFTYSDKAFAKGKNYYRIRQILKTGKIVYSKIILLDNNKININIYPNPATDRLTIAADEDITSANILIKSSTGQTLAKPRISYPSANTVVLDISYLPSGVYFVEMNGGKISESFVK